MYAALLFTAAALDSVAATGQASCPAVTAIDGPARAVERLASVLHAHRVTVGKVPGCGSDGAYVRLTPRGDGAGYVVVVDDRYGRRARRVIEDPEAAASIVESWTTDEDADVLRASTATAGAALALSAPPRPESAERHVEASFAASLDAALGSDRSFWYGGSVGACVVIGPACVGARARLLLNRQDNQLDADAGPTSRQRFDLLLTGALPWSHGRLTLVPSAGFGAGWVRTSASGADGQTSYEDGGGLRADLDVELLLRITRWLNVGLDAGVTRVFLSRTDAREVDGIFFAGEPSATAHFGVGCAFTP